MIADLDGIPIRNYPGLLCIFFNNGNLLQYIDGTLAMYNAKMEVIWSLPKLNLSHQLKLSQNSSEILAIGGEYHEIAGKEVRFDTLLIIDLMGKIRKKFSFFDNREKLYRRKLRYRFEFQVNDWTNDEKKDLSFEANHVNSFYEIPNGIMKNDPRSGYIVNDNFLNEVLFFDKDISYVVRSVLNTALTHDAQIMENGNLLWYKNKNLNGNIPSGSSVEVLNPLNMELLWRYQGDENAFFSEYCGGVQRLSNGDLLISDNRDGASIEWVSPKGKQKKAIRLKNPTALQDAQLRDLSGFLEKNRGL